MPAGETAVIVRNEVTTTRMLRVLLTQGCVNHVSEFCMYDVHLLSCERKRTWSQKVTLPFNFIKVTKSDNPITPNKRLYFGIETGDKDGGGDNQNTSQKKV